MMHSEQGFQSQLFKSMQTYLCNPDRVQPIIGLRSVIELCTATKPPMYLCEVCIVRANMTDIKTHITGSLHRYSYIVLHLHEDIYKEMISQPILDVLAQVKQIQQTQTNVTEFQLPFCRTTTKETHFNVTITQKRNPEQGSKQDHLATLKMRNTGTHTPAIIWNEDHCQNNDYLTSEELYRDTDWVLNNRKVGHEEGQHPQPFTADDALFMYEHMDQYQQRNNYSEEDIFLLQKNNEDSPENYSGTQPLIGLNAVIKCQSLAGDPPSCCYLCQPCSLKVLESDIIQHLISPLHQINYINFQYPHLSNCHNGLQSLETIAMQLEQEEGRGQMEVRRLSACLFNEVLEQDFYCSMKELNLGKGLTEKTRLNQKAVKKTSRITQDYNTPLKRTAGLFDCDESAAIGKPLFCHKRAKKKGKKKARLSEPVFKVSLLLNEGPMLVNRIPPVKETVAPEIE
ncbi:uncharacterized protein Hap1MRO34_004488 isoform 2-T2 [Clarias gariepinus]